MPQEAYQISFGGGIISPAAFARIDLQKFSSSVRTMDDFFVHAEGGTSNRAGLQFIKETKDSTAVSRLITFEFNEEQAYPLEFGDQYMRPYQNSGSILETAQTIISASQANPVNVGITAHPFNDGDQVFIIGVVGMTELNGKYFTVDNSTINAFDLLGVDGTGYAAWTSGGTAARVYTLETPYLEAELPALKFRQSNDVVYLTHRNHAPRKLTRTGAAAWTIEVILFVPNQAFPTAITVTPVGTGGSTTYDYKVTAINEDTGEESLVGTATTQAITGATQADPVVLTVTSHPFADGEEIHVTGVVGMAELNDRRFTIANQATNTIELAGEDGTGHTTYASGGSADRAVAITTTGNATLSSTNYNQITWTASAGSVDVYNVYKEDNGIYGYIGSVDSAEILQFNDKNIDPDLTDTAPKWRQPFSSSGNYPGCVGLHEQRSAWGNTTNDPLKAWLSQTGQFENMNVSSPTRDSDAVSLRLVTGNGNEIRHFRSFQDRLFTFTSGAVWAIGPGGDVDAITPSSKKVSVEEYLSSTDVPPITIKRNILMVSGKQNQGFEVHSLGYQLESDAYTGSDLTALARDLFQGFTIKEWAYAERPYRLVAAVRSDGKLLVMTYLQEHQVFAWSVWEPANGGTFESVCSVPEGQEDALYFVVNRTISGTKRYVERLHSRAFSTIEDAFFVDSGLTYTGASTNIFTNLDHLEGETIIALVDGNLETGLVVENGAIETTNAGTKVHMGLGYAGQLDSLPLNLAVQTTSRKKIVKQVTIRVKDTRGLFVGPNADNLEEYPSRSTELWGDPAATITDLLKIPISDDWARESGVTIQSEPGLPQTILSWAVETDIGE